MKNYRTIPVETGLKPVSTTSKLIQKPIKFRGAYRIESTRLKHFDYSSDGAYFITICTKNRAHFFGEIIDDKLQETEQVKICTNCWFDLPKHYQNCFLDAFIIMPNHVHGIIFIKNNIDPVETGFKPVSTNVPVSTTAKKNSYSISEIMRGFKTFSAKQINIFQNTLGLPFWQSRFHDRIIRSEDELNRIREYIFNNPINWDNDENNV